jgi:2-methylisocitrate lyase-like PEP mutase family enzyme
MKDANAKQQSAIAKFRELHESGCFVLPNPWDIGTTIFLEELGFKALATTSAGFAFSRGKPDGGVPRDEMISHIREIATASSLPVNADYLNGFADEPEKVAENVKLCVATGVAGLSIEDSTGRDEEPLYEKNLAIERVRAARKAIVASGLPVVLTARCETWLVGSSDSLGVALDRLTAYAEAGADCLYAPGVTAPDEIAQIVKAVAPKPVNVLVAGFNHRLSLAQLRDLGVRRISVGSALAAKAWAAFLQSARAIVGTGRFDSLANGAPSAELNGTLRKRG